MKKEILLIVTLILIEIFIMYGKMIYELIMIFTFYGVQSFYNARNFKE